MCAMALLLSNRRASGEGVQLRRPVLDTLLHLSRRRELTGGQHPATEGILVQRPPQDGLVYPLEIQEREALTQKLESDGGVVELPAQPLDRGPEDLRM